MVGYWGLSIPTAHSSSHRLIIGGRQLNALRLGYVVPAPTTQRDRRDRSSVSPESGAVVRLTVTPDRVERVDPPSAEMSFLLPDPADAREDVLGHFVISSTSSPRAEPVKAGSGNMSEPS